MAKDKENKTNAMRIIESAGIAFTTHSYESDGKAVDGVTVADKMGKIMNVMAASIQVLAITHLPQVAARGQKHYKVYKEDTADRTISRIKQLGEEERVSEIAKMLSGSTVSEAALANAKALLDNIGKEA